MAQNVSELWNVLWGAKNTEREYAFDIDGVWYGPEDEVEHKAEGSLYSDFGIGNATTSSLSLSLFADNIPRAAKIKRYIRLINGGQASEWLPKGIFWANRRAADDGYWTIEAFDGMRKADKVWEPDQSLVFPMAMSEAVEIIAALMGVEIDPRTELNSAYTIDYPVSDQTLRKTLQWIAAAHGGNFIITDEGKLLLVPLISAPSESNYIVTECGAPIVIGGMKILVDDADTSGLGNEDGTKFYVGRDIVDFANNGKYKPISRVTLLLDDENSLTAGNDTGFEIVADCPYATQAMVNSLLAQLKGYEYQSYEAGECNIDPAAELGDGLTVNGLYAAIGRIVDDGTGYPSLSAPGEAALDDEYPDGGPMKQEFNRKIADTRSLITKTAEEIRLEVQGFDGRISALSVTLDGVTIKSQDGTTRIRGSAIETGSITADKLNITGAITFNDLASDVQDDINDAYTLAAAANASAGSAVNTVGAWCYPGTTYIDGRMLMTGTVMATTLLGASVGLIAANQTVIGSLDIAYTTTGIGLGLSTNYGGIKITAGSSYNPGNVYLESSYGQNITIGNGYISFGGGPLLLPGDNYGPLAERPISGTYGQIYFALE